MEEREHPGYHLEDSDDFGLPETDFHPVDREEEEPPQFEEPRYYVEDEEENSNHGWVIAAIISFIVLVGLVVYLFVFKGTEQIAAWLNGDSPEPSEMVVATPEPEPVWEEPEPEPEPEVVYEEPIVEEPFSLTPYAGIERISSSTGLTYVVVGSFVDYDLAMDYARQLEAQGIGSKILDPTRRAPLIHRVAIADYNTFNEGIENIETYRANYGADTRLLKY